MVINIILACCIPLTLGVGGYFILKAFELGQATKNETLELNTEEFEPVQIDESKAREFQEFINEYTGL